MARLRLTKIASLTKQLDKVADELEKIDPRLALALDKVSDSLEQDNMINSGDEYTFTNNHSDDGDYELFNLKLKVGDTFFKYWYNEVSDGEDWSSSGVGTNRKEIIDELKNFRNFAGNPRDYTSVSLTEYKIIQLTEKEIIAEQINYEDIIDDIRKREARLIEKPLKKGPFKEKQWEMKHRKRNMMLAGRMARELKENEIQIVDKYPSFILKKPNFNEYLEYKKGGESVAQEPKGKFARFSLENFEKIVKYFKNKQHVGMIIETDIIEGFVTHGPIVDKNIGYGGKNIKNENHSIILHFLDAIYGSDKTGKLKLISMDDMKKIVGGLESIYTEQKAWVEKTKKEYKHREEISQKEFYRQQEESPYGGHSDYGEAPGFQQHRKYGPI